MNMDFLSTNKYFFQVICCFSAVCFHSSPAAGKGKVEVCTCQLLPWCSSASYGTSSQWWWEPIVPRHRAACSIRVSPVYLPQVSSDMQQSASPKGRVNQRWTQGHHSSPQRILYKTDSWGGILNLIFVISINICLQWCVVFKTRKENYASHLP